MNIDEATDMEAKGIEGLENFTYKVKKLSIPNPGRSVLDDIKHRVLRSSQDCVGYKKRYNVEIHIWLKENFNNEDYIWNMDDEFYFRNEEDAVAFKLRWI